MRLDVASIVTAPPPTRRSPTWSARLLIDGDDMPGRSPFLFLAEDWFSAPSGFPTHPHRGIETVTFVLEGEVVHRDHTGAHGVLREGDVQFMTAGRGILHSEMPGPSGVHSLQLWLNLPARMKRHPARYADMPAGRAPIVRGPGHLARLYAGRMGETVVPHGSAWPLTLVDIALEPGAAFDMPIPSGERVFCHVLTGDVRIGGRADRVVADQSAWMAPTTGFDGDTLTLEATAPSRLILLASAIIEEPIAAGGPFVMNTQQELAEAFADYRAGRLTDPAD